MGTESVRWVGHESNMLSSSMESSNDTDKDLSHVVGLLLSWLSVGGLKHSEIGSMCAVFGLTLGSRFCGGFKDDLNFFGVREWVPWRIGDTGFILDAIDACGTLGRKSASCGK